MIGKKKRLEESIINNNYINMRIVKESINDKYLFKCVFMAGGGGSGKGWVSSNFFGMGKQLTSSPFGVRVINSDNALEFFMKKNELPLVFDMNKKDIYDKQMLIRDLAKKKTEIRKNLFVNSMLPLIVDGTAREYDTIKKQKDFFESQGYDTSMVFVNTTLGVSLKRNSMRDRKVDDTILIKAWNDVQNNIGKYQSLFGARNFIIIDNSTEYKDEELEDVKLKMFKAGQKLLSAPLENKRGRMIIDVLQATGGKYISDIGE